MRKRIPRLLIQGEAAQSLTPILQRDYGGFDSAFFGVTLVLAGEKDWALYQKLRAGQSFPIEGCASDDELFHILQLASVASHEIRHFHDSLVSPYGAHAFRARVSIALNSLQLLDQFKKSGANCVPFPISQWCRLDEKERADQQAGWGQPPDGRAWIVMELPQLSLRRIRELKVKAPKILKGPRTIKSNGQRAIKSLVLAGLWYKERLEAMASDSVPLNGETIQSWEIFELSALLVQMADVDDFENGRGYRWSERFIEYIMKTETSRYGNILRTASSLWRSLGEPFDLYRTSLMAHWSILGAYSPDNLRESPANRFAHLWRYVRQHGFSPGVVDVQEQFKDWSAALKLSNPEDGLKHTQVLFDKLNKNLAKTSLLDSKWKSLFEEFTPMVGGVAQASDCLRRALSDNPAVYIDPDRYLNAPEKFPNVIIRTIVDAFLKFSAERCREIDVDHLEVRDGGPKTIFTERGVASKHDFVSLRQSIKISSLIGVSDLFFRDKGLRQFDARRARRIYEEDFGVQMREILN